MEQVNRGPPASGAHARKGLGSAKPLPHTQVLATVRLRHGGRHAAAPRLHRPTHTLRGNVGPVPATHTPWHAPCATHTPWDAPPATHSLGCCFQGMVTTGSCSGVLPPSSRSPRVSPACFAQKSLGVTPEVGGGAWGGNASAIAARFFAGSGHHTAAASSGGASWRTFASCAHFDRDRCCSGLVDVDEVPGLGQGCGGLLQRHIGCSFDAAVMAFDVWHAATPQPAVCCCADGGDAPAVALPVAPAPVQHLPGESATRTCAAASQASSCPACPCQVPSRSVDQRGHCKQGLAQAQVASQPQACRPALWPASCPSGRGRDGGRGRGRYCGSGGGSGRAPAA